MTKGYTTLVNKLDELETMLMQLLIPLPADDEQYRINLSQDIEQRLDFLKNLLSAEINASTTATSTTDAAAAADDDDGHDDLDFISHRLAQLDSSFRKWKTQLGEDDDVESTCSLCMGTYAEAFNEEALDNINEQAVRNAVEDDRTVSIDHRTRGRGVVGAIWRNCLVMGFGIVVGALSMIPVFIFIPHYFHMETQYQGFLIPT